MSKALIILAEGFEEVEAVTAIDVLRRGDVEVVIAALGSSLSVKGAHGIEVAADAYLESVKNDTYEAVVLPGGGLGTENLMASSTVKTLLQTQKESNRLICAICAAPSILGHKGLLKGKEAIAYPGFESDLEGAVISDKSVVRDDNIITAKGAGVAVDFGLEIVAALSCKEKSDEIRKAIQCI
jgi:4-methyl-5(b-hydroxyethyl)-thiazole monophosphate biosynthesis